MRVLTLTGAALIAVSLLSCNPNSDEAKRHAKKEKEPLEGFIPKDTANLMIKSYLESIGPDNISRPVPDLYSLIVDADMLREYLDNREIKKVKVMLAHTTEYIKAGNFGKPAGYRSGELTIVLAGYDKEENYVYFRSNMVPDHAMPCPRNCPDLGSASKNTLQ